MVGILFVKEFRGSNIHGLFWSWRNQNHGQRHGLCRSVHVSKIEFNKPTVFCSSSHEDIFLLEFSENSIPRCFRQRVDCLLRIWDDGFIFYGWYWHCICLWYHFDFLAISKSDQRCNHIYFCPAFGCMANIHNQRICASDADLSRNADLCMCECILHCSCHRSHSYYFAKVFLFAANKYYCISGYSTCNIPFIWLTHVYFWI